MRNGRVLPPRAVTKSTVNAWLRHDDPCLLLRLQANEAIPPAIERYLSSAPANDARETYKCRNREPWYVVPDVVKPDAFLTYMSGEGPALVANGAGCVCTNSVHAVRLSNGHSVAELQAVWNHPLARLSCEVEGHPLGGGMLKLEPGEAKRLLLPHASAQFAKEQLSLLREGTTFMRKWRHYA